MRIYQLVLLLKSDLKKEQKEKLLAGLKDLLGDVKSQKVDSLGERKFTYPIKRERKGEYIVINFETDKIDQEFNKRLLIKDEVLRHLLIRA
ncbi:MAG: 30S ribosomal protein S6 [Candidatus Levybacteria bacterium RIFCSPLOWO2_02_FULL_39_26]|nr:MAG: 30S ribosomal protein S6 [Candidatus Levybacteria bacterium GW2011_GWA1_39_11]OGH45181.1 MAG: 30S ribosomal protein S6 [Candidatus Levybacteria bacterium RIFCSPLOWO2_02_FULL_39_26]